MKKHTPLYRIAFVVAAAFALLALSLHVANWRRTGSPNWPMLATMSGLLILAIVSTVDPASKRVRLILGVVALLLVFFGSGLVLYRGGY